MIGLGLGGNRPLTQILCLGAHCDDIEIGCSGTVLKLTAAHPEASVTWVVMGSTEARAQEALESAHACWPRSGKEHRDQGLPGRVLPVPGAEIKASSRS